MTSEQSHTQDQSVGWLVPAAGLLLFGALTWPVWRWLWSEWMANDYYSHGVLIVPVAVYLAWRAMRSDPTLLQTDQRAYPGYAVLLVSLGLYLYFLNDKAYYLAAIAIIGLLAGLVWTIIGGKTVRLLAFPLAYLLLMVPLPFIERVTYPLAIFTGVCSTGLVKFLGLDVVVNGNSVSLPNAELVVGAQCSGINSMIALTALFSLVAYAVRGPMWGRLLLVLLAIPIAMLGNILRVANLLFVARSWGVEAAFTFYHDYSGIVFFLVVLLLIVPLTRLLRCNELRDGIL
jgi:exosortase